MTMTSVFAPITKTAPQSDGSLLVYGLATDSSLDLDEQVCDPDWLKRAMPRWFTVGNIREQHDPKRAVGKATEYEVKDDGHYITAKIVDPVARAKVETGVLSGFSVGINSPRIVKDTGAPGGRITDGRICEVSLVDAPCNERCRLDLVKAAKPGEAIPPDELDADLGLVKVEELTETPGTAAPEKPGATPTALAEGTAKSPATSKHKFTAEDREQAAANGDALADGSYRIETVTDLRAAIRRIGTGKNPAKARAHIKRRAKALGRTDLIPDGWKAATKEDGPDVVHDPVMLADIRDGLAELIRCELDELCDGEFELYDIEQLLTTLRLFMGYWSDEAARGETPSPYEMKAQEVAVPVAADPAATTTPHPDPPGAEQGPAVTDKPSTPPPGGGPVPASTGAAPEPADVVTGPDDAVPVEKSSAPDLAELVKSAVADAIKSSDERIRALEAGLAKALALPEPGGPVISRTAVQAAVARGTDVSLLTSAAAELLDKATRATDPYLAKGYRERAAVLTAQAAT